MLTNWTESGAIASPCHGLGGSAFLGRDLAGEHPTPIERLQVDQVMLCWLDSVVDDTYLAQRQATGGSMTQGDYYQQRARQLYLRAVKTLARLRRLLAPSIQSNVADKQIGRGGGAQSGSR